MERNRLTSIMMMRLAMAHLVLALVAFAPSTSAIRMGSGSRIAMDQDGGYQKIVVKISKGVPEVQCPTLLRNIKVGLIDYFLRLKKVGTLNHNLR